ncbi:hypothetical protein SLA2020_113000 [Shorea laevis]
MPKDEDGGAPKPDGLEIISIGSLYRGPWEKKYWSSSRGKDRYPYPVGYQAVRAHNGSTYKMEILEGSKGPLFRITSDGCSCSGQTPDISWEKFQKTGCPSLKIWHGKRFSCKIDGVEFFGFKNPFVQRLFRELVTNVNGTAEVNLLSSSFCNGASALEHGSLFEKSSTYPDLLSQLFRLKVKKKRSARHESIKRQSVNEASPKRPRPDNCNDEASNCLQLKQMSDKVSVSMSNSALEEEELNELPRALPASVLFHPVEEDNNHVSAIEDLKLTSVNFSNHPSERAVLAELDGKLFGTESPIPTRASKGSSKELDRLENTDPETVSFPVETVEKAGNSPVPKDSLEINEVQLCVPDTLDLMQDDPTNLASSATEKEKSSQGIKEDLTAADKVISDGLVTESNEEKEIDKSNSITSFEKSDFDSVGLEVAKSMMAILLPQAIPFLEEASRRKKEMVRPSRVSPCAMNSEHDDVEHRMKVDTLSSCTVPFPTENLEHEKMHIQISDPGSIVPYLEHKNSFIPDSFEDDQYEGHLDNHKIFFSNTLEADQETSVCHIEVSQNEDAPSPNELNIVLNKRSEENGKNLSETVIWCASPGKKALLKNVQGVCADSEENSARMETHSIEKPEKTCNNVEGNIVKILVTDTNAERGTDENNVSTQVQNKVYTRKKVTKKTSSAQIEKYCGHYPNSQDACAPKTCHGFQVKEATLNCASNNVRPMIAPNQDLICTSQTKLKSDSLNPSISFLDEQHARYDNEVHGQKSTVEYNCSTSSNQETSFCDINTSKCEVNSELEGNLHLVGCYVHPKPVLSILLSTKGNEISICASCGLLAEKERTFFIYRIATEEATTGCPSFVGYTPVTLPFSEDNLGREISVEKCGLQFTLDGQYLVLLDSFKTPHCREGRTDCICSRCTSNCFEENAVKIVQVKPGYVSLMTKLKTADSLRCVLVCETNYVIAAGKSGNLHVWAMNETWSAKTEEFVIPANDCISPCIVELKRIPKCTLVVSHNGFGEFSIWDILNRVIISMFSASGNSISQFVPISLITWNPLSLNADMKEHIDEIMAVTKAWVSKNTDNCCLLPSETNVAVWLLVSNFSESGASYKHTSGHCQENPVKRWRLALLVKNMVILGSALDPSAATVGASAGQGIMGTHDGHVYMWELSTGIKLGILHHFKGCNVSCIATDDTTPGVLAVGADDGQLLVYLQQPR